MIVYLSRTLNLKNFFLLFIIFSLSSFEAKATDFSQYNLLWCVSDWSGKLGFGVKKNQNRGKRVPSLDSYCKSADYFDGVISAYAQNGSYFGGPKQKQKLHIACSSDWFILLGDYNQHQKCQKFNK